MINGSSETRESIRFHGIYDHENIVFILYVQYQDEPVFVWSSHVEVEACGITEGMDGAFEAFLKEDYFFEKVQNRRYRPILTLVREERLTLVPPLERTWRFLPMAGSTPEEQRFILTQDKSDTFQFRR